VRGKVIGEQESKNEGKCHHICRKKGENVPGRERVSPLLDMEGMGGVRMIILTPRCFSSERKEIAKKNLPLMIQSQSNKS